MTLTPRLRSAAMLFCCWAQFSLALRIETSSPVPSPGFATRGARSLIGLLSSTRCTSPTKPESGEMSWTPDPTASVLSRVSPATNERSVWLVNYSWVRFVSSASAARSSAVLKSRFPLSDPKPNAPGNPPPIAVNDGRDRSRAAVLADVATT